MKPVKGACRRAAWLPAIMLFYLESLRRATFYAFGWAGQGQALGIMSCIVIVQIYIDYYYPSRFRRLVSTAGGLLFTALIWFVNRFSGQQGGLLKTIFGLPSFNTGSMNPVYYATFCFFVVFFYALVVFLLTTFVIERKSATEVFLAGVMLLAVEIVTSDRGILVYVVMNTVSGIMLQSQILLLQMDSDPRVRPAAGAGINFNGWGGVSLAVAVLIVTVALVLPAGKSKVDLTAVGSSLTRQIMSTRNRTLSGSDAHFDHFWEKMQGFQIKGEISAEDEPVMYVKSERPLYWRGESMDLYNGNGWESTLTSRIAETGEFPNPYSQRADVDRVEQVFSLAAGMSSQVIFTSGAPASVDLTGETLRTDNGDNLYIDNAKSGITYRVVSYVPYRNEEKLNSSPHEYPFNVRSIYLQLPGDLPARVRLLAEKLTAGAETPYEKARVIEEYLSTNYPYDLSVEKTPEGRDVVDYFLFDLKKGYCTYHSTAMVVLLRSIGIPARWVKGFTSGTVDPETGVYKVAMADAHAWVEVYFADFGWVPFEPTPSFAVPGRQPGNGSAVNSAVKAGVPKVPKVSPTEILRKENRKFPWGAAFFAAVTVTAAVLSVYFRRTKNMFKMGSGDKIRDIYLALLNLLENMGYPKYASQTPLEFADYLSGVFPEESPDITGITDAYLREKYGQRKLSREEVEEVQKRWRRLAGKWLGKSRD